MAEIQPRFLIFCSNKSGSTVSRDPSLCPFDPLRATKQVALDDKRALAFFAILV
jgi:hypothetical protein